MLGKLTKHEFLDCARIAFPSYIAVLIVSVVGRFLTWLTSRQSLIDSVPITFVKIIKTLSSLISTIYVFAFISLLVITILFMVYRFYRNFFTDEGYLMLTLPTRPTNLVFSKLFNSWFWIFLSLAIALFSLYITIGHYDRIIELFKNIFDSFKDLYEREGEFLERELGVPIWVFAIEIILLAFTYITRFILSWYASVAFGMLISKKHKIIGTIVAYIIIFLASWAIMGIYLAIATSVIPNYYSIFTQSSGKALQIVVIGNIIIDTFFIGLTFWFTTYIMKHRLNLD
ncbi:MAG: hypothetical protein GX241_02470 [Ruminococcaceae bacterium]|nr:hypothetical protein [Oscillospiraceae bacterium]